MDQRTGYRGFKRKGLDSVQDKSGTLRQAPILTGAVGRWIVKGKKEGQKIRVLLKQPSIIESQEGGPERQGNICLFVCLFVYFNVYSFLRDKERHSMSREGVERGRHRIQSGLQALSCQHRA